MADKWTVIAALLNPQTLLILAVLGAVAAGIVQGPELVEIVRDVFNALRPGGS